MSRPVSSLGVSQHICIKRKTCENFGSIGHQSCKKRTDQQHKHINDESYQGFWVPLQTGLKRDPSWCHHGHIWKVQYYKISEIANRNKFNPSVGLKKKKVSLFFFYRQFWKGGSNQFWRKSKLLNIDYSE